MSSSPVAPGGAAADFRPTHVVPQEGLPAWEGPDVSRPTAPLDPFLPVQLLSRRGEWGQILCSNGWSAWVDGRLLVAVPQPPPTAQGRPPARTEDPGPLLARSADALERYRRAAAEHAAGRTDAEAFRRSVRGLRAGIVLDGESVWLYDDTGGRWLYGDGTRLTTYAVATGPGAGSGAGPAPAAAPRPEAAEDPVEVQLDVLPEAATGHAPTRIADGPGSGPGER
ncbi:hypothetical protein [Streptomyces xanthophaeus]|uniref:hypothetical protein n=1 Tax=Streptomyces xanthophaeus TaxID=67385 RepID=UPI00233EFFFF|nr:hypothetical protein [Streptomyces xanthophaeus]WCD84842.1 hypothetical protein KPP03845_101165 [Streptomyces xanthophaeus]